MKITINSAYEMQAKFKEYDRDYFSVEGYEALLNYYDEIDPDMELDVIAICCGWHEYGTNDTTRAAFDLEDLFNSYGYLLDDTEEHDTDSLIEEIGNNTMVIPLSESYLVAAF